MAKFITDVGARIVTGIAETTCKITTEFTHIEMVL